MKLLLPLFMFFCQAALASYVIPDGSITPPKMATSNFSPQALQNCGFTTSVASNAITINVTNAAGSTPTALSPCRVSFRNATATNGYSVTRTVSSSLSFAISSGSTLGCASAKQCYIYWYLMDNSGTVEIAASSTYWTDDLQTTTTEGGAGAADSSNILYSSTGRTSKAVRLLGRSDITEATAGTWATNATNNRLVPFYIELGPQIWAASYWGPAASCTQTITSASPIQIPADTDCNATRIIIGNATVGTNTMGSLNPTYLVPGKYSLALRPSLSVQAAATTVCTMYFDTFTNATNASVPPIVITGTQYSGSVNQTISENPSQTVVFSQSTYAVGGTWEWYVARSVAGGNCVLMPSTTGSGFSAVLTYWPMVNGT